MGPATGIEAGESKVMGPGEGVKGRGSLA
jgi:hypothetical protein